MTSHLLIRGNALRLPLADESVHLVRKPLKISTQNDMMARAVKVSLPLPRLDSPRNPLLEAKRIMATAYPIVPGVRFKGISGFPNYCVGDDGSVWSRRRRSKSLNIQNNGWGRLKVKLNISGYHCARLYDQRTRKQWIKSIPSLVLEAFVGPRLPGMECCHYPSGDKSNNRVDNLRWGTRQQNVQDGIECNAFPKGSQMSQAKLKESDIPKIRALIASGMIAREIGALFGVGKTAIYSIHSGRTWGHVP